MTEHRFTKGVPDYACGATELLESRVREFKKQHNGELPAKFVLHVPTVRRIFTEMLARQGRSFDESMIEQGGMGMMGNVPFYVCECDNELAEDLMISREGEAETL